MSDTGVGLFSIARESVVCVNVKVGEHIGSVGTGFLYKQQIDNSAKNSRLYFFTNLHVVKAIIDNLLYLSSQILLKGGLKELPFAFVSWTEKSSVKLNNLIINEIYIPSEKALWNIGSNPAYNHVDFAILIFNVEDFAEEIPSFKIKETLDIQEGKNIYAFGYPVGMDLTVSKGVVSHVYECANLKENNQGFYGSTIQHDILINHGNSGGPTIDENGFVVGISTMGFDPSKAVGINFSLNMNCILRFLDGCNGMLKLNLNKLITYHIEKTIAEMNVRGAV